MQPLFLPEFDGILRRFERILLTAVLLVCGSLTAIAQSTDPVGLERIARVVASDPGSITVEIGPIDYGRISDEGWISAGHPWLYQSEPGERPSLRGLVALPSGATEVTVLSSGSGNVGGGTSVPKGFGGLRSRSVDPVNLGITHIYGLTIVSFEVPITTGSSTGRLPSSRQVRILYDAPSAVGRKEQPVPRKIRALSASILNTTAAWRASRPSSEPAGRLSVASAVDGISGETVVIRVDEDGPVVVTAADLRSVGLENPSVSSIRISNRSEPVPLFVSDEASDGSLDGEDYLLFAGRRFRGDRGFFYSELTDTNAYFLTVGGGPGFPPVPVEPFQSVETDRTDYPEVRHFEEEGTYFFGFSLPQYLLGDETTIHNTDPVQHERYYWRQAERTRTDPILFDASPSYRDEPVEMAVRVAGTAFRPAAPNNSPDQVLTAFVNGIQVGTVAIRDTADTTITYEFSSNVLVNGTNELEFDVVHDPVDAEIAPNVRVDYLKIDGAWNAVASPRAAEVPEDRTGPIALDVPLESGDLFIVSDRRAGPVPAETGDIVRVTSRAGTPLRSHPGFYLAVGNEQVSSPAPFNLGISIAEIEGAGDLMRIVRYEHFAARDAEEGQNRAATFVEDVADGNLVVAGLAFGMSRPEKTDRFVAAFRNLGSSVIENESFFAASWVFVARKGSGLIFEEYGIGTGQGLSRNVFVPSESGSISRISVELPEGTTSSVLAGRIEPTDIRRYDGPALLDRSDPIDLVIVTPEIFRPEAERLAEHRRAHNGYRVEVVDLHRIYDEFNRGIKDPDAIRRFLQHAADNWGTPEERPTWGLLFGDANWDRERRLEGSTEVDFLPSFGVPSSDHLFSVAYGDTTLTPRIFIGRIPCRTITEASAVVDKLIAYDLDPPAAWNKRTVFATGGLSIGERNRLRDLAHSLGSWFSSGTFGGVYEVIARSGQSDADLEFPNEADGRRVRDALEGGALWFDFNGHGATTTLDLNFGFVEDFENDGRPFVFATWSCNTGLFSHRDAPLRNETFLTHPEKGSIASIGSTTSSFTNMNDPNRNSLFQSITTDPSIVTIGETFFFSKMEVFARNGFGDPSRTGGVTSRNHTLTYALLGDPSMHLAVSPLPELAVPSGTIDLGESTGGGPAFGDSILSVTAEIRNHGWGLDARRRDTLGLPVNVSLRAPDGAEQSRLDTLYFLSRAGSIDLEMPLESQPGEYVVIVDVDPFDEVQEGNEEDNRGIVTFVLQGSRPLLLEPLDRGVVDDPDLVEIRLLNPSDGPGAEFLLGTDPSFQGEAISSTSSGTVREAELTTTWQVAIPQSMRGVGPLWFRAVSTAGDRQLAEKFPLIGSFSIRESGETASTVVSGEAQMLSGRNEQVIVDADGIGPGTAEVPIYVEAIGQTRIRIEDPDAIVTRKKMTVRVGSVDYRINEFNGINVLVFPVDGVEPVIDTNFYFFNNPGRLADFERLIQQEVDASHRVILGTSGQSLFIPESDAIDRLRSLFASLGGSALDEVDTIDIFASYALIGGKGEAGLDAKEAYMPGFPRYLAGENAPFPVELRDTISVVPRAGRHVSATLGPALSWESVAVDATFGESGEIELDVLGIRSDGRRDTIPGGRFDASTRSIDIRSVDVALYPRIALLFGFEADTTVRIERFAVDYVPAPELAIVPSTIALEPDSLLQGDPASVSFTVANLTSFAPAESIGVLLDEFGDVGRTVDSTTLDRILPLDSVTVRIQIPTVRYADDQFLIATVNPNDRPADPFRHTNRTAPIRLRVTTDDVDPDIVVYADARRLVGGDYTAPQPVFEVRLSDNSRLALDSMRAFTLILDNRWITIADGGEIEVPGPGDDGSVRGRFRYRPEEPLEEGAHDLLVFARDASGNGDTTEIITFFVERDLGLRNVVNWPNPMQKETTFTFTVTGERRPVSGEIAIYTPAGRKIRTIEIPADELGLGFNRVEWDGRDGDGDRPANGVYLYRLRLEGADGEEVEVIEKIAILR